ncbi:MAG TPA: hypothetical protein VGO49_14965 [Bradyrhizobium sp.]|nr:hypothetical protein [Bradyrhizobium sp.]
MTVPPFIDRSPKVKLQHAANMHRTVIANPPPLGLTVLRVVFGLIALALTAAPLFVVHYLRANEQAEHRRHDVEKVEGINVPVTERSTAQAAHH